jgi:hypothetical protein
MERGRLLDGPYASVMKDGCNGAFVIKRSGVILRMISSDGTDEEAMGWEHVSVSCLHRTPRWEEMCWVKDQFWEDEEVVHQIHPKHSQYVNYHPFCLHMWRHKVVPCPCPPPIFVGPQTNADAAEDWRSSQEGKEGGNQ